MSERKDAAIEVLEDAMIQREMKDDYRKVFLGSKEGVRVLTDLLQHTGVLRSIVGETEYDTRYNAGKQEVGLLLMDILDKRGYEAIIELEKFGAQLTQIGEVDL